jgi:cytochrome b561
MTPTAAYVPTARALHWLTALFVLSSIPAGVVMVEEGLPRALQNGLFMFHKNVGVVILLLVVARLVVRAVNPPPPLPSFVPSGQAKLAHAVHMLLYLFLIVMAVSGYVRVVAGGFPLEVWDAIGVPRLAPRSDVLAEQAKYVHGVARFGLGALIVLHIGGASYHGMIRRDGVVRRMWPGKRA